MGENRIGCAECRVVRCCRIAQAALWLVRCSRATPTPAAAHPAPPTDVPGLLEGAHAGVGLGHQFLRHCQRCRVLVHVVDGTRWASRCCAHTPVAPRLPPAQRCLPAPSPGSPAACLLSPRGITSQSTRRPLFGISFHDFPLKTRVSLQPRPHGRLPSHPAGAGAVQPRAGHQAAGEQLGQQP